MNYYERHLGDYAKDTAHLTMLEHGAYTLLLDRYYSTESGIPAAEAHRVARARSKDEKAAVDAVLNEFFHLADGVWTSGRAEEEIASARLRIGNARENGKKGGRPKKGTQKKPVGLSPGSENETQPKAHQSPDTKHQSPEEESNRQTEHTGFDDDVVPRDWVEWAQWFEAEHGIETNVYAIQARTKLRPLAEAWVAAGVTTRQMSRAIANAKEEAREPIAYLPSYVDRVLATMSAAAVASPRGSTRNEERNAYLDALTGKDRPHAEPDSVIDVAARVVR